MQVVADTGPINYLVQIGAIDVLPKLFARIIIPTLVYNELNRPRAPAAVRDWIARIPAWLTIRPDERRDWNDARWCALDEANAL